jgi:predicted aldo/keto reductase-like oxidoreductase
MNKRTLGKRNPAEVSVLGFGCMRLPHETRTNGWYAPKTLRIFSKMFSKYTNNWWTRKSCWIL